MIIKTPNPPNQPIQHLCSRLLYNLNIYYFDNVSLLKAQSAGGR